MAMYDQTTKPEPGNPPFRRRKRLDQGNETPGINGEGQGGLRQHQRFQRPTQRPSPNEGNPGRPMERDPMDGDPPEGGKWAHLAESKPEDMPETGSVDDGPDQEPDNDPDDSAEPTSGTNSPEFRRHQRLGQPDTDPQEGDRLRAIQQTIRARGPEVTALVQRRRAQMGDRYRKFGNTPTGNDENAPKPRLRPGRRAFNPYGGSYS